MLNLKKLAKYTTEDRKERSKYVTIAAMKTGYTPAGLGFVAAKTFSRYRIDENGRRHPVVNPSHYVSQIVFIDHKLNCHVACSCQDNTFVWETANSYKGAAEIEYSNGEPPDIKNPNHQPGLCVDGNALVATSHGYVRIKNIRAGDKVYTTTGLKTVTASARTGSNRETLVFKTRSGRVLKVTPEHVMYVLRGHAIIEVPANKVKATDHLILGTEHVSLKDKKFESFSPVAPLTRHAKTTDHNYPTKLTPSFARFLGYILAEGCSYGWFSNTNQAIIDDFIRCLRETFGEEAPFTRGEAGVRVFSGVLQFLLHIGVKWGSYNVAVPDCVLQGTRTNIVEFLYGYSAGDGHLTSQYFTIGTASKVMAQHLSLILSSLDIHTFVHSGLSGHAQGLLYRVRAQAQDAQKLCTIFGYPEWMHEAYDREGYVSDGTQMHRNSLPFKMSAFIKARIAKSISKRDLGLGNSLVPLTETLSTLFKRPVGDCSSLSRLMRSKGFYVQSVAEEGRKTKPRLHAYLQNILEVTYEHRSNSLYRKLLSKLGRLMRSEYNTNKDKLRRVAAVINIQDTELLCSPNTIFDRIEDIRSSVSKAVYDITVADDSQFFANGILVHNCKHLYRLYQRILPKLPQGS